MPTSYEGREDDHDLGGGRSFRWLVDEDGRRFGIIEHHPKPDDPSGLRCGGYVAWRNPSGNPDDQTVEAHIVVRHRLVSEEPLTIEPSLLCRTCGHHGWVRDGRWVAV